MTSRQGSTKRMLWEHVCYIWLTLQFLWTRVRLIHIHLPTILPGFWADPYFSGLDPQALPAHLRLSECTDLLLGYAACYCIFPVKRKLGDWVVQSVSWPFVCRGHALQRPCRSPWNATIWRDSTILWIVGMWITYHCSSSGRVRLTVVQLHLDHSQTPCCLCFSCFDT